MPPHYFTIHYGTGATPDGEGQEMAVRDETGALILTVAFEADDARPLDRAR